MLNADLHVEINNEGLTMDEFRAIVVGRKTVVISNESKERVEQSHRYLQEVLDSKQVVYGVNTGFGQLSTVILPDDQSGNLQLNLIRSHACAVGEPYTEEIVRAITLLRLVSLTRGYSGVRPVVTDILAELLNHGIHAVIPQQGSLGASGDLAPLSHLALVLLGEGEAYYQGERISGGEALKRAGIQPIKLTAKEGLALINGTQAMTAVGLLAYQKARFVEEAANVAVALTMQALDGILDAFSEEIQMVRPYPEQAETARQIRHLLQGSGYIYGPNQGKVQDAYSIRCVPQVHGASMRALNHVEDTLNIELNAVTDNPTLFAAEHKVYSGGNFHGQPIALAMDYMKIAVAEYANISERRTERLVNPQLSGGLPPFLTPEAGVSSGLMILQYVSASLVSENKVLAHPASVDSIPSSGNQEDHVSMGTTAARQVNQIVDNASHVLAIELICAAQALEWKSHSKLSPVTQKVKAWIREIVPAYKADRVYSQEIQQLSEEIRSGRFHEKMASFLVV
ncbi:histidine ammonia-lyase [Paenibacillus sp. N1-5-1-14]|nr:histidine ammonia-lyase [Paenibacillus radicibacter]MCR8641037.1 histidine ammonia-lyase [Paenibacillus radicibacter]